MWRNRKGQSMAEYALVAVIVIAAVVGMQTYYKRGLQAKIKGVMDGMNLDTGGGAGVPPQLQYEPYYTKSTFDVSQKTLKDGGDVEEYKAGGTVHRDSERETRRLKDGFSEETGGADLTQDDAWK